MNDQNRREPPGPLSPEAQTRILAFYDQMKAEQRELDGKRICWCGQEIQPGQDHGLCYPGME
ncbi:hypothetical protein [Actinacidiphila acididurans]|uniref:Uncharacterized protein n=1 Tax=Actinacidiphila acididurans TaxID=2784346 RepID=A0ABS2U4T5_9ACTN|nr:hypothetical protein [Actinacidiphila acididurans]MBM9510007.1 hypothetical protein [Actinacidiphila acididurans]